MSYFNKIPNIEFEGTKSSNMLSFKHYEKRRVVLGKTMEQQLRFAVCYWHSFCWSGVDPFGSQTIQRPWFEGTDEIALAEIKLQSAFEFFTKLGVNYFCFHDIDIAPEQEDFKKNCQVLNKICDQAIALMEKNKIKLLWGTTNLFTHKRYMAGAATNPDPEIFACAAAQVKNMLHITKRMDGENYVLWGGREGYETMLNTDFKKELDQLGKFINMVVEYKHKINFNGTILIEPKPQEPTKHQYDYDCAAVYAFLQKYGLEKEVKVNIEVNHATLANHSFEHEVCYAIANGIFGSLDINRGDAQSGWDTDQFPNNLQDIILAFYHLYKNGGFTTGGLNFDAKIRRQSLEPEDLFYAHIGAMDICARALIAVEKIIESNVLDNFVQERYQDWGNSLGKNIMTGKEDLDSLYKYTIQKAALPKPKTARQEYLENLINSYY